VNVGIAMAGSDFTWPVNSSDIWWVVVVAAIFSYLGFFLIGKPIVRRLARFMTLGLASITAIGAIAGTVVFAIFGFVLAFLLSSITDFSFGSVIYGGILGASVALIYGLIAGPSNLNGNVSE
jgi:hypothetical protein